MIQLSDFFATLNFFNLSIFFLSFFIFDAAGVNIACILKPEKYLRSIYWIWGMALFVFLWFILHFFLPFWPVYVWISLISFGLMALPLYLKNKGLSTLIQAISSFPYPLLVIPLIFKPFYFLLNAPPYYADEMAYHFYSPAQLMLENHWSFWLTKGPFSVYQMMPRMLDTSFILMFSLTKTYASARLLNFLLVFSSFYSICMYYRQKIGRLPAKVFSLLFPLITASTFLAASTLGYVDAGSAVLMIVFLMSVVDFINKPCKSQLFTAAIVLGITISMKYTSLAFGGSILGVSAILILIVHRHSLKRMTLNKNIISIISLCFVIFILFGGYWYLKNFLISGNPIYPFVFSCWHDWPCGTGISFFQAWATAFDKAHFPVIRSVLFQGNILLFYLTLCSVLLSFLIGLFFKNKIIKYLIFIIIWSVIIEIIISKNITGFELRYYFHWFLLIPCLLAIPFTVFLKPNKVPKLIFYIYFIYSLAFIYVAGSVTWKNLKRIYKYDFVPANVRNYAMHRINLNEWLNNYFPKMNDFIKWCGQKKSTQDIIILDPALSRFSEESLMSIFMVNCRLVSDASQDNFLIASETPCVYGQSYFTNDKDPMIQENHKLNQQLICGSKEILKNLYLYSEDSEN